MLAIVNLTINFLSKYFWCCFFSSLNIINKHSWQYLGIKSSKDIRVTACSTPLIPTLIVFTKLIVKLPEAYFLGNFNVTIRKIIFQCKKLINALSMKSFDDKNFCYKLVVYLFWWAYIIVSVKVIEICDWILRNHSKSHIESYEIIDF